MRQRDWDRKEGGEEWCRDGWLLGQLSLNVCARARVICNIDETGPSASPNPSRRHLFAPSSLIRGYGLLVGGNGDAVADGGDDE